MVIVSTVRCNKDGKTGFLQIANRVNVMMSRARHGMYVFGSSSTVDLSRGAKVFQTMLAEFREREAIGKHLPLRCVRHGTDLNVTSPEEFTRLVFSFFPWGSCLDLQRPRQVASKLMQPLSVHRNYLGSAGLLTLVDHGENFFFYYFYILPFFFFMHIFAISKVVD